LAGQTGGAVRVVLDFFVSFCVKAKRKVKQKAFCKGGDCFEARNDERAKPKVTLNYPKRKRMLLF